MVIQETFILSLDDNEPGAILADSERTVHFVSFPDFFFFNVLIDWRCIQDNREAQDSGWVRGKMKETDKSRCSFLRNV